MNNKTKLHMSTDEFRKAGYKAIDWIADYYEKIDTNLATMNFYIKKNDVFYFRDIFFLLYYKKNHYL